MSEPTNEVTVIPTNTAIVEFGTFRSPAQALKEMEMVAAAFGRKARQMDLYTKIGESEHLRVEGWQMLAAMYRVTASIQNTQYVEFGDARGWEATAIAIHIPTGQQVSSADAMCLDDEDKWGAVSKYEWHTPEGGGEKQKVKVGDIRKPLQQLRSMAQTRAQSKVLSNLLKHVAKMAGFAPTPAEEMMPGQESTDTPTQTQQQAPPRSNGSGPVITDPQAKRFYALSKASGKSKDEIDAMLRHFGFASDREITKAKYDAVCNAVQTPNWQPSAAPSPVSQPQQQTDPSKEMWAEVVRAYKGESKAIQALGNEGYPTWAEVPAALQSKIAMKLIEEIKEW
jgi:hypothetical protein